MSGGTNVGGTNVGGTFVCGTKVSPPTPSTIYIFYSNLNIGN
jgi:hypothetical protein